MPPDGLYEQMLHKVTTQETQERVQKAEKEIEYHVNQIRKILDKEPSHSEKVDLLANTIIDLHLLYKEIEG